MPYIISVRAPNVDFVWYWHDAGTFGNRIRATSFFRYTPSSPWEQLATDMPAFELTVVPPLCVSDFDDGSGVGVPDGGVTIEDLLFYVDVFAAGNLAADVDDGSGSGTPDGGVTIDDLLYFLSRFEAGC